MALYPCIKRELWSKYCFLFIRNRIEVWKHRQPSPPKRYRNKRSEKTSVLLVIHKRNHGSNKRLRRRWWALILFSFSFDGCFRESQILICQELLRSSENSFFFISPYVRVRILRFIHYTIHSAVGMLYYHTVYSISHSRYIHRAMRTFHLTHF